MMREEFLNAVVAVSEEIRRNTGKKIVVPEPTDSEYVDIEYVYTWYPTMSETDGKKQIAWLYVNFGMCAIRDMYETASLYQDLDDDLRDAQNKVKELSKRIERLKKGDKGYEDD